MSQWARKSTSVAALVLGMLAFASADAFASHFRYGTIRWQANDPTKPNVITFTVETAWRVMDGAQFYFGDGTSVFMSPSVTAVNPTEDWIAGVWTYTKTYPATAQTYDAYFTSCCRISNLQENNGGSSFVVGAKVTVNPASPNRPPVSSMLPIIRVPHNQQQAGFTIPASDPDGDPLTFRVANLPAESGLNNPVPSGLTVNSATGLVTWDTRGKVLGGFYVVQFIVSDNRGASTPIDVLLRPTALVGTAPTLTVNGSSNPGSFTIPPGGSLTFTIQGSDPDVDPGTGQANSFVTLSSGSRPLGSTMTPSLPTTGRSPVSSTFSWTPPLTAAGTYAVSFVATDDTGSQGTNSVTISVLAKDPPIVSCSGGGAIGATSASGASATISSVFSDPDDIALAVTWEVDGSIGTTENIPAGSGTTTRSLTQNFGFGAHVVRFRVSDNVNPAVVCTQAVTVADTTAPGISGVPNDATLEAVDASGAPFMFGPVTASDSIDGDITATCSHAAGVFPLGSTSVTCSASDSHGNTTTTGFKVDVVDTIAPALSVPPNQVLEALNAAGAPAMSFAATATDAVDANVAISCSAASGTTFPLGETIVSCKATDDAGNTSSGSFTITVQDTTAPALSVPGDQTLEALSASGAPATFLPATASDAVDTSVTIACSAASGDTFSLGTTTVTCSATDDAGNSRSGSFTITVRDTTAPVLSVPDNQTLEAVSASGAPASFLPATASDAVDTSVTIACSAASGATFSLGTTTVTCSATDDAGNSSSGSFTITVRDTTAPVLNVPGNQTLEALSAAGAPATFAATGTDAVDANLAIACSAANGDTFPLGTTLVTCTATDDAGNATSSAFSVTVRDTTAPSLSDVTPSTGMLWPPNHKMVEVGLHYTATDAASASACRVAVASNEPVNATGDGDTAPDWQVLSPTQVELRAERASGGSGRIYTLTVTCTDASGNTASDTATVTVPKSMGR